jgi:hypothetical protein
MEPLSADDPRQIGGFTLRSRLGAGGMGRVYLAFSPGGRAVAMKVVHPGLAADPEFLRRFRNEVAAARAVSGMYTAPVVGAGIDDNPPWLATAYVPGPPLAEVVSRYGALPETAVWRLGAGLAEALRAVHACGLVHRDLKPGNVLLAADGPHVIDFGISRAFEGTSVTSTGMVVGTPGYMSPEQAEGQQAGPPSDVFSLGCVLAYAATGNAPFGSGSAASILYRVVTGEPDLGGLAGDLRQVVTACLVKNPAQRIGLAQLVPMIAALGPALPTALGAFWPEPLAGIIAANHTHPVTQVSALSADPPPISQVPVNSARFSPAPVGAAQVGASPLGASPLGAAQAGASPLGAAASPLGAAPASAVGPGLAGPGLAGPASAAAGPVSPAVGFTGHAPMVPDGYLAAAAYGASAASPIAPGTPSPAPVQPPYGGASRADQQYRPQHAQPVSGLAQAPQYPADQQASAAPLTTPASHYTSQYTGPAWPQQGAQAPAPGTPWPPQQPASGGSWPGAGQPSGPGGAASGPSYPGAASPLAQYSLGSGPRWRPTRAEIPVAVLGSIRLMYIGAAATLANLIVGAVVASRDNAYWTAHQHAFHLAVRLAAKHDQQMAGALDLTTVVGGALGIACWLVMATACRRARPWTRVAATVLLALDTASLLTVLLYTHDDPGAKAASIVVWIVGLAATIPLWTRQATNFFLTWRRQQ